MLLVACDQLHEQFHEKVNVVLLSCKLEILVIVHGIYSMNKTEQDNLVCLISWLFIKNCAMQRNIAANKTVS